MQFIFLEIALGFLFSHFHRVLSTEVKQVWEFGKELPQSYIILNEEGRVNKRSTVLDLKIPHCNEVDYVKVEVDNPAATPEVTSNFKSVTIIYNKDQKYNSTYKVVIKSHKTCDLRRYKKCKKGRGNICIYGDEELKKKPREPKHSSGDETDSSGDKTDSAGNETDSSGDEKNTSRDKSKGNKLTTVWNFGKDVSGSFLMAETKGRLGKGSKGVKFKLQETSCQQVAYLKVEVENSAILPKVTSNKKIVSISYNPRKNIKESTYTIHAKGVKSC